MAELAMEIAGDGRQNGFSELFSSHAFWLGSIRGVIFNFFYIIPALQPDWTVPAQFQYSDADRVLASRRSWALLSLQTDLLRSRFFVLKDVLLTIWVTVIVTKLKAVTASASGVPFWLLFWFRYQQGLGAYIGLFLVMLLVVRKQIAGAFRDFFKPGELKPFAPGKWTLVVFCGGVCLLPVVFTQAGIALWFAAFLALLLFVSVLVMARLRAQAGVPMIYLHIVEARSFVWLIGGGVLAATGESTVAGLIFVSFLLRCSYLTPYQSDGFRISEETGFGYRRWIILSMLAVIVGFVLTTVFQLSAIYEYGFNN